MVTINMLSSAEKVKGQGVASAYREQVDLVSGGLGDPFQVRINKTCIADITHYHTIDLKFFLTIPLVKRLGKTVGYVHFLPETIEGSLKLPPLVKQSFYRYIISFYHRMDYLVTVNPYFIERLVDLGIPRDKITYIPNYVSDREFHPLEQHEIEGIKKRLGIPVKRFTVLGVGQVQTRKGVRDFIEVARMMPDVQFLWAGGFSFGRITEGYEELSEIVENPPANVKFLGIVPREEMNGLYNVADVLFMPSYNELFPMAILEALNCRKPILLRDLDIYRNILFDYYLRADDNGGFAGILSELQSDPAFYGRWSGKSGECGRLYSREHVLGMWKDFYESVCLQSDPRVKSLRRIIGRVAGWKLPRRGRDLVN